MTEEEAGELVRFFLNQIADARFEKQTLAEAVLAFKGEYVRYATAKRKESSEKHRQ